MWMCNNGQKVIAGALKDLLVDAAKMLIYDMVEFGAPQDMRNKKIIEETIQTLNEECEITADLNPIFENLSPFEKIYATHYVLIHLFNSKVEAPGLSLWMEGTIDVLFNLIESHLTEEIDVENEDWEDERFKYRMRKLIIEAAKQYSDEKDIRKKNIEKNKQVDFWIDQIEFLKEQILFCDHFSSIPSIENTSKENKELVCKFIGINIEGQYLPTMKIEKKTIVKMINDILKMKS